MASASGLKGNPAAHRMGNQKLKNKRAGNATRNERVARDWEKMRGAFFEACGYTRVSNATAARNVMRQLSRTAFRNKNV